MQTSKIKIGSEYALQRGDGLVRFRVVEIVTRKTRSTATNEIVGFVVEDGAPTDDNKQEFVKLDPERLIGPYEEQIELVARKALETIQAEAKKKAEAEQARADRLALYEFVGVEPPQDVSSYNQHFRIGYGGVSIEPEGARAIAARVRELNGETENARALRVVK